MGMYDFVMFECLKCGELIEHQSKAGDCNLVTFFSSNVPSKIAADILNDEIWCENCGSEFKISGHVEINLKLVLVDGR